VKAIGDIFEGMGANNCIAYYGGPHRCRASGPVKTGSQKFITLANYYDTSKGFEDLKFVIYDTTRMNQAPQDRKVGGQGARGGRKRAGKVGFAGV